MDYVIVAAQQVETMPKDSFSNFVLSENQKKLRDVLTELGKLPSTEDFTHDTAKFEKARSLFEYMRVYLSGSKVPEDRDHAIEPYRVDTHISPDSEGRIVAKVRARDNHHRPKFLEEDSAEERRRNP